MPHMIDAEGLLVLAYWKNSVLDRQVFAGQHQIYSRASERA